MNVVSNGPLRVSSLRWQPRRGQWALTVVAKATFRLVPGTCTLSDEQEDPNEHENHWDDDERRSLYSPSDLAPFKPAPEVMLVGNAFAPRGEPVAALTARMIVGKVDKSIVVRGDRSFLPDGSLRPAAPFRRMALRYERAAGGPGTPNPVGMARARDAHGLVALPNLEPPGLNVARPDDFIEPVGFAPIAADWPTRRDRLGRQAGVWSPAALRSEPVPEWLDQRFFLSAPGDQYLDELRANERIVLENLHPEHERLVTNLPGWEPRAVIERPRAPAAELAMTCDTLWIDTDRSICTLTWRGSVALEDRDQEGRVVIGMEAASRPAPAPREVAPAGPRPAMTMPVTSAQVWPAWLAGKEGEGAPSAADALRGMRAPDVQAAKESAPPSPRAEPPKPAAFSAPPVAPPPPGQTAPVMTVGQRAAVTPAERAAAGWLRSIPATPPSLVTPPAEVAPPPPAPVPPPPLAPAPLRAGAPPDLREAAGRGVAAVSDAAAARSVAVRPAPPPPLPVAAKEPEPAPSAAREVLRLVWFDDAAVPRIRRVPRWKPVLAALESEPLDRDLDDPAGEADPMLVEDRREVFEIAARATPTDARGVSAALEAAVRADGKFAPPLVLVAGDLETPFDELAHLEATIAVATPLATNDDKELQASLETAQRFLKNRGSAGARSVARSLATTIRDAFAKEKKLSLAQLDEHVHRSLREERSFQRREVLGEKHLRLLLRDGADEAPLVLYAPEAVAKKLPMYARFAARIIAEVHLQEDEAETAPAALRVLALVRRAPRSAS